MVVKIMKSCPSVKNAMDYNERKVACGDAELLATVNKRACDASFRIPSAFLKTAISGARMSPFTCQSILQRPTE